MLAGVAVAVVEVLQTYYILLVLGHPSLPNSFVIFATVVVQGLIGLLPGNIGGMEGTHLFIFNLLRIGSDPSLVYTLILRIGQMTMVLLGLLNIFAWRVDRARVERRRSESNRCIKVLQTSPLPLGYGALTHGCMTKHYRKREALSRHDGEHHHSHIQRRGVPAPALAASVRRTTATVRSLWRTTARGTGRGSSRGSGARIVRGGVPGSGRNRGAAAARGEFLLFLDADTVLPEGFISKIMTRFEKEFVDICVPWIRPIDGTKPIYRTIFQFSNTFFKLMEAIQPQGLGICILATRRLHSRIGGFSENIGSRRTSTTSTGPPWWGGSASTPTCSSITPCAATRPKGWATSSRSSSRAGSSTCSPGRRTTRRTTSSAPSPATCPGTNGRGGKDAAEVEKLLSSFDRQSRRLRTQIEKLETEETPASTNGDRTAAPPARPKRDRGAQPAGQGEEKDAEGMNGNRPRRAASGGHRRGPDAPRLLHRVSVHCPGGSRHRAVWNFPAFFTIYMSLFRWRLTRGAFSGLDNYAKLFGGNAGYLALVLSCLAGMVLGWILARRQATPAPLRRGAGFLLLTLSTACFVAALPLLAAQGDAGVFDSLRVTIWYAVFTVPGAAGGGAPAGGLPQTAHEGKAGVSRDLPHALYCPTVATAAVFELLFSLRPDSFANQLLRVVGIEPVQWLQEPTGIFTLLFGGPAAGAGAGAGLGATTGAASGAAAAAIPAYWAQWAQGPSLALAAVIFYSWWIFVGYYALIFLNGLSGIPRQLYEAAEVDGAGKVRSFFSITLPLLSPTTYFPPSWAS